MLEETCLKRKIKVQCPCGYIFATFNDCKTAIIAVKSHFESFHRDFLPFGITDIEVLAFINKGRRYVKQKVSLSNLIKKDFSLGHVDCAGSNYDKGHVK